MGVSRFFRCGAVYISHRKYNPEPMDTPWKDLLRRQLGAAIDMLENAVLACPDELWSDRSRQPEYWYGKIVNNSDDFEILRQLVAHYG
ncbi:MAG TPA: hypothetical protein VI669_05815 [Vicinamibacteria bacterium]